MLWHFNRLPDGSVQVVLPGVLSAVIQADQWAAIVARVSVYGEDAAAVEFARLYHNGELDRVNARVKE